MVFAYPPETVHSTRPSTTLLVSPGAEGIDLLGVEQPEDEILEEPEQHLAMNERQRVSREKGRKTSSGGRGNVKQYDPLFSCHVSGEGFARPKAA